MEPVPTDHKPQLTQKKFWVRSRSLGEHGPVRVLDLMAWISTGSLSAEDTLRVDGTDKWVSVGKVDGLSELFNNDAFVDLSASQALGQTRPAHLKAISMEDKKEMDSYIMKSMAKSGPLGFILLLGLLGFITGMIFDGFSKQSVAATALYVILALVVIIPVYAIEEKSVAKRDPKFREYKETLNACNPKIRAQILNEFAMETLLPLGEVSTRIFGEQPAVSIAVPMLLVTAGKEGVFIVNVEEDRLLFIPGHHIREVRVETRHISSVSDQHSESRHLAIHAPLNTQHSGSANLAGSLGKTQTNSVMNTQNEFHTIVDIFTLSKLGNLSLNFLQNEHGGKSIYNAIMSRPSLSDKGIGSL